MESVVVALIVAVVGPAILHLLNRRDLTRRIGSQNGNGDLYAIAERTEAKVDSTQARVVRVEERAANIEARITHCETRLDQMHRQGDER